MCFVQLLAAADSAALLVPGQILLVLASDFYIKMQHEQPYTVHVKHCTALSSYTTRTHTETRTDTDTHRHTGTHTHITSHSNAKPVGTTSNMFKKLFSSKLTMADMSADKCHPQDEPKRTVLLHVLILTEPFTPPALLYIINKKKKQTTRVSQTLAHSPCASHCR